MYPSILPKFAFKSTLMQFHSFYFRGPWLSNLWFLCACTYRIFLNVFLKSYIVQALIPHACVCVCVSVHVPSCVQVRTCVCLCFCPYLPPSDFQPLLSHSPTLSELLYVFGLGAVWLHHVILFPAVEVPTQSSHSPLVCVWQDNLCSITMTAQSKRVVLEKTRDNRRQSIQVVEQIMYTSCEQFAMNP